jgi:DNA-binding CsgD family transcriptional regulator
MNDASLHERSIARQRFIEPNGKKFSLTPLEKQLIALVLAGCTSKESACRIGVSEHSVRQHLRDIIAKLGVSNRLELVLFALHRHLIDPVQISPFVTEVRLSQTRPPARRAA